MGWVYLDDNFPDHPKVAQAGGDAGWLFVCGLAWIKRFSTEGRIPKGQVAKLSDRRSPQRLARRLVEAGLWVDDGEHYRVHDYHEWNKPGEARAAAARKAARARWSNHTTDANASATHSESHSESHSECNAEPNAPPHASTCPIPPTPSDTSSQSLTGVAQRPGGDDRIEAACEVLADRDLAARQGQAQRLGAVERPDAWRERAVAKRRQQRRELERLIAADPTMSAAQLANRLEPPEPANPSRHIPLADEVVPPPLTEDQRAAAREAKKQLPRLLRSAATQAGGTA